MWMGLERVTLSLRVFLGERKRERESQAELVAHI